MQARVKVAVFAHGETEEVWRLALAAGDGAAGTGADVRVRRLGRLAGDARMCAHPRSIPIGRDAQLAREASPSDLAWADVALFGTATPYGVTLDRLTRFIDATVPLWREGRLAGKVYGAFTAAAAVHGGPDHRLVSLIDLFHHWGGLIVPLGGRDPLGRQTREPAVAGSVVASASPFGAELAAAQGQGRRATEAARALKVAHLLLADVA